MVSVTEVRQLIYDRPGISLRDLAWHFKVSAPMMEMMLDKLVSRSDVEVVHQVSCGGGDCGCSGEGHGKGYRLTLQAAAALQSKEA